jgi:hypothetical protein
MDLRLPYRLAIGVIGNCSLANREELRRRVKEAVDWIFKAYPSTDQTEIKLCVLSTLCDGSERFAAGEILELCEGSTLKAILPLTISDCLEDFKSEASRDDFRRLLSVARHQLSLKEAPLRQEYPEELVSEARRQAYEDVGKLIVRNCDVLVIVGDECALASGGVLEKTIAFAREMKCPTCLINSKKPALPDYTERSGATASLQAGIDAFNRRVAEFDPGAGYAQNVFDSIFCNSTIQKSMWPNDEIKKVIRNNLIPYYVTASSLAKQYQKIYRRTGLTVFWLAFGIVSLVSAGIIFFNSSPYIFLVESFLLICISTLIAYAGKKRASHRNWIEHRFLAERIRSGIFIAACNVEIPSELVDRRGKTAGESDAWMNLAFEEIWSRLPRLGGCNEENCQPLCDFAAKAWIDEQIGFHERTCQKNLKRSRDLELAGEVVFYIAMIVALLHFILPNIFPGFNEWHSAHFLTLFSLVLPALGATLGAVRSHREYKRLAMRSKKMVIELRELKGRFKLVTPKKLEALLHNTEKVMLKETLDWLALMKFAELHKAV